MVELIIFITCIMIAIVYYFKDKQLEEYPGVPYYSQVQLRSNIFIRVLLLTTAGISMYWILRTFENIFINLIN